MYRYYDDAQSGAWMMILIPLMWLVIIGLTVWLVGRLCYTSACAAAQAHTRGDPREAPEEIVDRRFASGEIDAETHAAARRQLREHALP